jgi:hypothetical protein
VCWAGMGWAGLRYTIGSSSQILVLRSDECARVCEMDFLFTDLIVLQEIYFRGT